jgi:hypothetical protein
MSGVDSARCGRVFYRAINACPRSKAVWLHCLRREALRGLMTAEELGDVVRLMGDKQLRQRTMLEEVLPAELLPSA